MTVPTTADTRRGVAPVCEECGLTHTSEQRSELIRRGLRRGDPPMLVREAWGHVWPQDDRGQKRWERDLTRAREGR